MNIVVATNNLGKLRELRRLLPPSCNLLTLGDVGLSSPDETGDTFSANALIKAHAAAASGYAALADDSGLEVEALNGEPGVRSARFAGPAATDTENNQHLLKLLKGVDAQSRRARFIAAVAIVTPSGREHTAIATLQGSILCVPRGSGGFGYDALFEIDDPDAAPFNGRTLAELSLDEKSAVSHRFRAYSALSNTIRDLVAAHHGAASER